MNFGIFMLSWGIHRVHKLYVVITDLDREYSYQIMSRADTIEDGSIVMLATDVVAASFFCFCTSEFSRIGAGAGGGIKILSKSCAAMETSAVVDGSSRRLV